MRIAITATAVRTALGDDVGAVRTAIDAGRTALAPLEGALADGLPDVLAARIGPGEDDVEDDPALRILGPHGRHLERVALALHAAAAGARVPRERLGLFVGLGMVDSAPADLLAPLAASRAPGGDFELARFFGGAYRQLHPLWPLAMLGNVAAGQIAIDLDVRGDNVVLSSDADAGLAALLEAAHALHEGSADAALAVGVGERVSAFGLARWALEGRLDDPGGFPPGEGAGGLWLERAPPTPALAYVLGGLTAFGSDGRRQGPTLDAWERAIAGALETTGTRAADVREVVRHAEGSRADEVELDALGRRGLERATHRCFKRQIGFLGAGAAAAELALALASEGAAGDRLLLLAAGADGTAGAVVVERA